MTTILAVTLPTPASLLRKAAKKQEKRQEVPVLGNFSHFGDAVRKDFEFMKNQVGVSVCWANETFRIPQVSDTLRDVLWLRNLENPNDPPPDPQTWPQPSYPVELSGVDLLMADLEALQAYGGYFYYLSQMWSKPLPEVYDPQEVADYFNCRPHLVALRLLEMLISFSSAAIRIRASGIRKFLRLSSDEDMDEGVSQYNLGMVLKETMLDLGPTFIKVGQSLSTRPDIIGTEISKALSELHEQIPAFPRSTATNIIEEELGLPVDLLFSSLSEEPVAAASFGQVYRGSTHDGRIVAVKVQRPNLLHTVVRDIYILRLGLGLLQKIAKRKSDPRLYADELGRGFVGELDYTLEAANSSKFQDAHSFFSFMHVPKVYPELSRKRVLTMEWVNGDSPNDLLTVATGNSVDHGLAYTEKQIAEAKRRLLDLVSKGVEASLVQLLETGLLHADPHPGNLRYTSSGQIGFLDFGLICQMERKHQFAMLASIVHIVNGDWRSLVYSLTEMDVIRPGTNLRLITMELENSLGEVEFKDGMPDVKFSRVLGNIISVAIKYHFRMPPYFTLVLRSLASLEGLAVAADPNFKTFEAAYPFVVQKLLTENSAESRKILHSVVLNKKKEFRWERLTLFLRVGSTRKVLNQVVTSRSESSGGYSPKKSDGVFDVAHLILRLLPSKDGIVLRKLLMTADGASLMRAMISKEALPFRQQLCRVIADLLHQWMAQKLGQTVQKGLTIMPSDGELSASPRLFLSINEFESIVRDRRFKVIFSRILRSSRKDSGLILKVCWTSFTMAVMASAVAFHRLLVSLSETYIPSLSFAPKRVAVRA